MILPCITQIIGVIGDKDGTFVLRDGYWWQVNEEMMALESRNKLVHESFRIDEAVLGALRDESRKGAVPLSHLVNKILRSYVECDRSFRELGFIPISKDSLRKLYDRMQEKDLVEDGKEMGSKVAKEYISYFFFDVNIYTLIEFLELWFSKFHCYKHKIEDKYHYFSVNHDINMNYSIYCSAFLSALIEPIIKTPVKFTTLAPNLISFCFSV
jgi:hypothetical protein